MILVDPDKKFSMTCTVAIAKHHKQYIYIYIYSILFSKYFSLTGKIYYVWQRHSKNKHKY